MEKRRQAAGVLPLCIQTERVCLVQRAENQSHPGTWSSFGGSVDPGESIKEAAHREFREETLHYGKYKLSSAPFHVNQDGDLTYSSYLGIFDEEFVVDIEGANEGQDYGWFNLNDLPENIIPGTKKLFKEKTKFLHKIIAFYKEKK